MNGTSCKLRSDGATEPYMIVATPRRNRPLAVARAMEHVHSATVIEKSGNSTGSQVATLPVTATVC
jgi:hypothetical protein